MLIYARISNAIGLIILLTNEKALKICTIVKRNIPDKKGFHRIKPLQIKHASSAMLISVHL